MPDVSQPYVKDAGEASQLAGDCCDHQLSTLCLVISFRITIYEDLQQIIILRSQNPPASRWRVNVRNRRFCISRLIGVSLYLRPELQPASKGGEIL